MKQAEPLIKSEKIKNVIKDNPRKKRLSVLFDSSSYLTKIARCSNCPFIASCDKHKLKATDYGCDERKESLLKWLKTAKASDFGEILVVEKLLADLYVEYELKMKDSLAKGKLFDMEVLLQRKTLMEHFVRLHYMKHGRSVKFEDNGSYAKIQARVMDAKVIDD